MATQTYTCIVTPPSDAAGLPEIERQHMIASLISAAIRGAQEQYKGLDGRVLKREVLITEWDRAEFERPPSWARVECTITFQPAGDRPKLPFVAVFPHFVITNRETYDQLLVELRDEHSQALNMAIPTNHIVEIEDKLRNLIGKVERSGIAPRPFIFTEWDINYLDLKKGDMEHAKTWK